MKKLKLIIIIATVLACAVMLFIQPIPQDEAYHHFADGREWAGVPNFWNVVSNAGFLIVGLLGLSRLSQLKTIAAIKSSYTIFLIGVTAVAFGSGYYHWKPDNHTLLWDRLPMTIAFMALMAIVLGEFLSLVWAKNALYPLLCIGATSVLYWYWGEQNGTGDLRPYALVQFLPMILMLILFVFGKPVFSHNQGYWWLLFAYVLAKLFERFDAQIYQLTNGLMAGHALKHIAAACGLYALLRCYAQRTNL